MGGAFSVRSPAVQAKDPVPAESDQPFAKALRGLMKRRDVSFRAVETLTNTAGHRLPYSYIGMLARGEKLPTPENMETLAVALGVQPTHFREYREHVAAQRARVLAARLGLDLVLEKLAELED